MSLTAEYVYSSTSSRRCKESELSPEAAVLLRNFPCLSDVSDLLKSAVFVKVIQYLIRGKDEKDDKDTMIKVFNQVNLRQYQAINWFEWDVLDKKRRLTHIASESLLIIETARSAHRVPLTQLNRAFVLLIDRMPFDYNIINPSVQMNYSLSSRSGNFHSMPDFAVLLARQSGIRLSPEVICIGECVFSHSEDIILKKLQPEVDAHPEVAMVLMIVVKEATPYHSPKENSAAWQTFRHHPKCLTQKEFLGMMESTDDDSKWLGPVTVAAHAWCHVSNVDYYVWVKDGEEKITVNMQGDHGTMAHGTLFPQIDMGAVDDVIEQGLLKMRDAIVDYSIRLDPQTDTSLLSATNVPWDFNWSRCQKSIENGAESTAHERMQDWYIDCFRRTKWSIGEVDSSYNGSDPNSSDSTTMDPASHSGSR